MKNLKYLLLIIFLLPALCLSAGTQTIYRAVNFKSDVFLADAPTVPLHQRIPTGAVIDEITSDDSSVVVTTDGTSIDLSVDDGWKEYSGDSFYTIKPSGVSGGFVAQHSQFTTNPVAQLLSVASGANRQGKIILSWSDIVPATTNIDYEIVAELAGLRLPSSILFTGTINGAVTILHNTGMVTIDGYNTAGRIGLKNQGDSKMIYLGVRSGELSAGTNTNPEANGRIITESNVGSYAVTPSSATQNFWRTTTTQPTASTDAGQPNQMTITPRDATSIWVNVYYSPSNKWYRYQANTF